MDSTQLTVGESSNIVTSHSTPKYVGYYQHGNHPWTVSFNYTEKPNWFRRALVGLLLGWKWVDHKDCSLTVKS